MAETPIRMSFMSPMGFKKVPTEAWEVKPAGFIARLCWMVLGKLGSVTAHFNEQMIVRQVIIDPGTAAKKVIEMADVELARVGYRPERILVGRRQFEEIASAPDFFRSFSFNVEMAIYGGAKGIEWGGMRPTIERFSVPVYVIPWMDGVLVL